MAGTDFSHLTTDELIKGIKALDLPDYIRSKAYGIDVRETLAQMTEMTIQLGVNMGLSPDDALKWARKLQESVSQSEFDSWVATLLDGGPSLFFETKAALVAKHPNGAPGVALVRETDPAKIYVWNGTAWEDFGDYQGIEVKEGSITTDKIANGAVAPKNTQFFDLSGNILQDVPLHKGKIISPEGTLTDYPDNDVFGLVDTDYTESRGKVVHFSRPFSRVAQFGDSGVLWSVINGDGEKTTVQISQSVSKFYVSFDNRYTNTSDIVGGVGFIPSKKYDTLKDEYLSLSFIGDDKKDLTIELIGDSLTDQGLYIETLKKKTGIENIINHGISGARVAQISEDASYDKDDITLVYRAKNNQIGNTSADITCIVAGINDWNGWRTLGDLENSTKDTEFYGAYKKVIEHILTNNPNTTLLLATPTYMYQTGIVPPLDGDIPRENHGTGLIVKDFRDAVINLGEYYKLPIIDLYTLSGINKMTVDELTSDGLHYNAFGGKRIGNILGEKINQQT